MGQIWPAGQTLPLPKRYQTASWILEGSQINRYYDVHRKALRSFTTKCKANSHYKTLYTHF